MSKYSENTAVKHFLENWLDGASRLFIVMPNTPVKSVPLPLKSSVSAALQSDWNKVLHRRSKTLNADENN